MKRFGVAPVAARLAVAVAFCSLSAEAQQADPITQSGFYSLFAQQQYIQAVTVLEKIATDGTAPDLVKYETFWVQRAAAYLQIAGDPRTHRDDVVTAVQRARVSYLRAYRISPSPTFKEKAIELEEWLKKMGSPLDETTPAGSLAVNSNQKPTPTMTPQAPVREVSAKGAPAKEGAVSMPPLKPISQDILGDLYFYKRTLVDPFGPTIGMEYLYLAPDGQVSRFLPANGFDPVNWEALRQHPQSDANLGNYYQTGDLLYIKWTNGKSDTWSFKPVIVGGVTQINSLDMNEAYKFKAGHKLDGRYLVSGLAGGALTGTRRAYTFKLDGTCQMAGVGNNDELLSPEAGRYQIVGYTLRITNSQGTITDHTILCAKNEGSHVKPSSLNIDGNIGLLTP